jgi:hypothetical protein
MWYHEHAQMAIIMTNLHATGVFDPIDTLAIGQSFQTKTGRALLPSATSLIDGLLFFRPMNSGAETELNNGAQFNSVFYKFPMYFNPTLEIRGSFFSEAVVTLRAKDVIGKLIGMEEMQEAPSILMKNLQIIKEDYLAVKELYMVLAKELEANRQQMNFNSPLLLSRNMKDVKVPLYSSMGSATYYFFSNEDGKIVYKTTPGKKEVLEKPKAEMPF